MRVVNDEVDFAAYLLDIGNGTVNVHSEVGEDIIQLHKDYLVDTMDELINKVFSNVENSYTDKYFVARCTILTPKNENVDKINEVIMTKFPGEGKTYLSADTVGEEDSYNIYPIEFLNSITLSGMPPHAMTLKIGAPVMLLRNLRAGSGNGL